MRLQSGFNVGIARHPGRTQEILAARGLFNESPTYHAVANGSSIGLSPWFITWFIRSVQTAGVDKHT